MNKKNKTKNISRGIINNIEIKIPEKTIEFEYLLKLLTMCNNTKIFNNSFIQATSDPKLKPTITFVAKIVKDPSFSFTGSGLEKECFYIGKLPIGFNFDKTKTDSDNPKKPIVVTMSDNIGEYLRVKWPFATYN